MTEEEINDLRSRMLDGKVLPDEAFDKLEEELDSLRKKLESERGLVRWIPIDQLPDEPCVQYLVRFEYSDRDVMYGIRWGNQIGTSVTHYMNIPRLEKK